MALQSGPELPAGERDADSQAEHRDDGSLLDLAAIRSHAEIVHRLAARFTGKGKLIVAGFGEDPDQLDTGSGKFGCPLRPIVTHIAVGDVQAMVRAIADIASRPHYNAYVPLAVF